MLKYLFIMNILRWFIGLFKNSNGPELKEFSQDEFEKLKFKARIALIDDEEVNHLKRLKKEGYNIFDAPDIDTIDDFISKRYHVVILDIQGVGKKVSPNTEGWGILRYLKSECPHTVVIMFTGADWSVTKYKHLVDMADDFIGKDLEYLDFKSKLDSAIKKAFSPKFQFEVTKKKLHSELSEDLLKKIEISLFKHGGDKQKALSEVKKMTSKSETLSLIDTYLSVINSIKDLIK